MLRVICATRAFTGATTRDRSAHLMPSAEVLNRFIARVEANAHVEAIEEFYAPDASMQENDSPPRVGRKADHP